jgi:hypothetical protein
MDGSDMVQRFTGAWMRRNTTGRMPIRISQKTKNPDQRAPAGVKDQFF